VALGNSTAATGESSLAFGHYSTASGIRAIALGELVLASGDNSVAIGSEVTAKSFREIVLGSQNTSYTPNSTTAWNSNDRLFTVANGNPSTFTYSDALTILKSGKTGIGTNTPNSTLSLNGSMTVKTTAITTSNNTTTLGDSDYMVIYSGSISSNTITLPAASSCAGRIYMVINHSDNAITISSIITSYSASTTSIGSGTEAQLVSDGTNWHWIN
jgi:hypothetical protein